MMQCSFVMILDFVLCTPPARAGNEHKPYNGMLPETIDSVYRTVEYNTSWEEFNSTNATCQIRTLGNECMKFLTRNICSAKM